MPICVAWWFFWYIFLTLIIKPLLSKTGPLNKLKILVKYTPSGFFPYICCLKRIKIETTFCQTN